MIRSQYKYILLIAAVLVILLGAVRMLDKPIDLSAGQTSTWWQIINNVQSGRGYKYCEDRYVPNCEFTDQETAIREPLPIYFYAVIGRLTDNSLFAFQWVQIALVLLIMLGVFFLARELGGISTGSLAALMWAVYLPAVQLEAYITGDLLEGLFVTFGLIKFVHIVKHNRLSDWLQFGVLFGLASLSRSAALSLVAGLGLGYIVFLVQTRRASLPMPDGLFKKIPLSMIVFILIVSPWVIRNYIVFRAPVVSTTLVGYNLYRHNSIVALDEPPHYVTGDEGYKLVSDLVSRRPELLSGLNEVQVNLIFQQEALKLIRRHPLRYMELVVYRILPLWFNVGVGALTPVDYINIVEHIFLMIIFILGLRKNDWPIRLIGSGIFIYLFTHLLVNAQLRYTVPIMAGVIAIGSVGLVSILPPRLRQHFF